MLIEKIKMLMRYVKLIELIERREVHMVLPVQVVTLKNGNLKKSLDHEIFIIRIPARIYPDIRRDVKHEKIKQHPWHVNFVSVF